MKLITRILGLIALVYAVGFSAGFSTPAGAQVIDRMTAPQLLVLLRENISALQETETILRRNSEVAETNRALGAALREESTRLDTQTKGYDDDAANHNRQAGAYNTNCQQGKLPEEPYTQCLDLKQNLDIQKTRLDALAENIEAAHATYNQKVKALNQEETTRFEAASHLIEQYKSQDQMIRDIQVQIYELATNVTQNGFSETVRQCTLEDDLEDMYSCMTSVWG